MADEKITVSEAFQMVLDALAMPKATDQRFPFKAPDLPVGVIGTVKPGYIALDSSMLQGRYQWLNNSAFGCGMGFPGYQYLAELSQKTEYRAPAETIAAEATRRFFELVSDGDGDKSDKIKELMQDVDKFKLRTLSKRLIELDYTFGRAQLAINIKGQSNRVGEPLLVTPQTIKVGSLDGFKTVEPMWTSPLMWNALNPAAPDFYKPTSWFVMGVEWHATRLLTFVSRELPDMLKPAYNFGGMSMSQLIEPYVQRWLKTVDSVNRLVSNFAKLGIKTNMQSLLAGDKGAAQDLIKRLQMYTQGGDNRGVFALDKDSEEMFLLTVSLANLHELQAQSQEHMAMPTHIPLVKLCGTSPAGLNASSEGEIKVYYDWVNASTQAGFLGEHMQTLVNILQLNRYGVIDESIKVRWIPLDQPTDAELATMRKSDADAGSVYLTNGVISPEEERARLQSDPNSGYDNLTGAPPEHPDDLELERGEEAAAATHERGLEVSEEEHERGKETAKEDHKRALELEKVKAKNKPKPKA